MLLIKNGIIHTMDRPPIHGGCVLIKGKCIEGVFTKGQLLPETKEELTVIDAKDCWVLPGLIDAHSHVGISEDSVGEAGQDANEMSDPITPSLSAVDGINPLDPAFQDAVKAGITAVMTGPGSSNIVGGRFAFVKTSGRVIDDMVVKSPAAMKVAFGENPKMSFGKKDQPPVTRMAIAAMLREELLKAKQYAIKRLASQQEGRDTAVDFHYESWLPVLAGKIPVKAHVHRADDIQTAIRIGKEFGLQMTLDHCSEGHLIPEVLKASGHPIIIGPALQGRFKPELSELSIQTPAILEQYGMHFALMTDHPVCPIYMLPLYAGISVREGLSMEAGLKSITCYAAEACGVSSRVGRISKGLDADIAIFDGNPLETLTKTLYTIINGNIVYRRETL